MASATLLPQRSHAALLSRLIWPTTVVFAVTLCVVFAMVLWTSNAANHVAAERQRGQLAAALEQTLEDMKQRLAGATAGGPLLDSLLANPVVREVREPLPFLDFAGLLAFEVADPTVPGSGERPHPPAVTAREALLGEVAATLGANLRDAGANGRDLATARGRADLGVARLVHDGGGAHAVVGVPVEPVDGTFRIAIASRNLTDADLGRLAGLHDLSEFRFATQVFASGYVGLPVYDVRGDVAGYFAWRPDRPGDLMRERLVPLTLFGSCVALVLFGVVVVYVRWIARDLALSQERAQNLLGRDPLSGLANRLFFSERLEQELQRLARSGTGLAVMFLDLDRFKDVNDTYGHEAGDDLIKQVAKRLAALLRGGDTLARFGGDEFAIIQTDLRAASDADALARRVLDALTRPFDIAGAQVTVGVSIGVALAPLNGDDRELLMRLADTALYQSKNEGRNRHSFFERKMDETIRMRKVVEDDLRLAIEHDELALHYQPLYSADGLAIVGLEALVRWPHPKQGLISPARFISLAEERGLVIPLGEWVLRRACEDGKRWPGLRIAVNVSAIQFRHRDFVASVTRALKETGFDAARLELELTEGVVVEDADAAEAAMMELRAMGVHLALDDFGTGYSSLIYLRRFAFDKIKIDRSFLESMEATGESAILVHSIVHLGRALGLTVTAEGVETKEQHRFLQALGCHQLQGFLFSKPVPADDIDRLLGIAPPEAAASAA